MKIRTRRATCTVEIDDATFEMEQMTPQEMTQLMEKVTKVTGKGPDKKTDTDHHEFNTMSFIAMCKSWNGITDEEGKPAQCDEDTKRDMYRFDNEMVLRILGKARDQFGERVDLAEKN